jgi:hypothetical protein
MSVSAVLDPTSLHFDALAPGTLGGGSVTIASAPSAQTSPCTSTPAVPQQLALAMPDAYLTNSVGTTYVL